MPMGTESAGPSLTAVTSATSTQETAVMGCDLQKLGCGGLTRLATGHHHLHHPDLDSREFWSSPPWWSRSPADSASPPATTGHAPSVRLSSDSATEVGRLPHASHPSFQTILSKINFILENHLSIHCNKLYTMSSITKTSCKLNSDKYV